MFFSVIMLASCSLSSTGPEVSRETGQVIEGQDRFGTFYSYAPTILSQKTRLIVLVHGTPPTGTSAEDNAKLLITRWSDFAESHDVVLIAPAFTQEDFSSRYGDRAMSGYCRLFGRQISADEWALRLPGHINPPMGCPAKSFSCMDILPVDNLQLAFWLPIRNI